MEMTLRGTRAAHLRPGDSPSPSPAVPGGRYPQSSFTAAWGARAPPHRTRGGVLAAEQRLVEGVQRREVLDVRDPLVHGSGQVVAVVQAAQDDAGEVDGLHEDAEQRALDSHHVPPAGRDAVGGRGPGAGRTELPAGSAHVSAGLKDSG